MAAMLAHATARPPAAWTRPYRSQTPKESGSIGQHAGAPGCQQAAMMAAVAYTTVVLAPGEAGPGQSPIRKGKGGVQGRAEPIRKVDACERPRR